MHEFFGTVRPSFRFQGIIMRKSVRVPACGELFLAGALCIVAFTSLAGAAQIDIQGPAGSVSFGSAVAVLPNGNFVVTDPDGPVSNIGAVYLYSPNGTLISTLTGSSANDAVGSGGIAVVGGGNFVVLSPNWNNAGQASAGAVTWVNGSTGLNGVVAATNSLVGTFSSDGVGTFVSVLTNGNYVVASPYWNSTSGAATWGSGASGVIGAVGAGNSLMGSLAGDYVALTPVVALSNGNYVVASHFWNNNSPNSHRGAATWGNGNGGTTGSVSAANSLIGSTDNDAVATLVTPLTNGNYVVGSPNWSNGALPFCGAATWVNGSAAHSGTVSAANSLVGTTQYDQVSFGGITALSNGNYVVGSPAWGNGTVSAQFGAATWGNGTLGTSGAVSAANSLIGTSNGDQAGDSIAALTNGAYVVGSSRWKNGTATLAGAATRLSGSAAFSGTVSAANSLVGTTNNDRVAGIGITALSDGNYVVDSANWNNGVLGNSVGAATWGSGTTGISGPLLASKSLYGTTGSDYVGTGQLTALRSGNYVVISYFWNKGIPNGQYGAATWSRAGGGTVGSVSAANSLIGSNASDHIGIGGVRAFSDGNYAIASPNGANNHGAVTLASGGFRLRGVIAPWNSVIGGVANPAHSMSYDYDTTRHRLVVGRPAENIVSLFSMDQIFADDLEP